MTAAEHAAVADRFAHEISGILAGDSGALAAAKRQAVGSQSITVSLGGMLAVLLQLRSAVLDLVLSISFGAAFTSTEYPYLAL